MQTHGSVYIPHWSVWYWVSGFDGPSLGLNHRTACLVDLGVSLHTHDLLFANCNTGLVASCNIGTDMKENA